MQFSSVALLVDGDNVPAHFAGKLLREAGALGPLQIRRVYGNAHGIAAWSQAPSYYVLHAGNGKNGADLLLAVQAMEFALRDGIEAFALASSDADFSHLARRLREFGKHVMGLGEEKAKDNFRKACARFVELKKPATAASGTELLETDRQVVAIIEKLSSDGGGVPLTKVNEHMRRLHDFKISAHDAQNWLNYFKENGKLYELDTSGPEKLVRLKVRDTES